MASFSEQLKAVVAGLVGLGATWAAKRWGFDLSPEVQAAIVGGIIYIVTYVVPNAKPSA